MNKEEVFSIISSIILVLCGFIIAMLMWYYVDLKETPLNEEPLTKSDFDLFLDIGENFSKSHTYCNNKTCELKYNCINYTNDFVKEMKGFNISLKIVAGCNETDCHQWIRTFIDFEPQRDKFVDYSEKYPRLINPVEHENT